MKTRNFIKTTTKITAAIGVLGAICALLYTQAGSRVSDTAANMPAGPGQMCEKNVDVASGTRVRDTHAGITMASDIAQPPASATEPAAKRQRPLGVKPVNRPLGDVLRNVGPMNDWREFKPASITIAPAPEMETEFQMDNVRTEHDRTIWTGRNPGLPGAFLVTVATQKNLHIALSYGSPVAGSYLVKAEGETAEITEQPKGFACGVPDRPLAADSVHAASGRLTPESIRHADTEAEIAAVSDGLYVDVLFFYTADMLLPQEHGGYGTEDDIKSSMMVHLEAGNRILQNSRVDDFRWRFADCYEVPEYASGSSLEEDLAMISNTSTQVGTYVEYRREQHHADQVQLWVLYGHDDEVAGIGEVPGYYSVVVANRSNLQTVTHELAHNFNCLHDRLEPESGASDDDKKFNYAWSIKEELKDGNGDPVLDEDDKPIELYYGTVMSYAKTERIDYFSNPAIPATEAYLPARFGNIGVPAGRPKAADNALNLGRYALWMSTAGDPAAPPKILAHPQSVTMGSGYTATLKVFASSPIKGGEVLYTWRKGTEIVQSGADDSFMVGAAGIYHVEVSNNAGTVTSNPATVFITSVEVPPTYTDSSGGGGAPSILYIAGIFLLFIHQIVRRKNNQGILSRFVR